VAGEALQSWFVQAGRRISLEAFLVSTGIVALAEMGDKTQLLSLVLAVRFRRPIPIILGILAATLVNHAAAGAVGAWINRAAGPDVMRWALGLSFVAMAIWMLIPDKLDEDDARAARFGVFGTTAIAFFLAEMGDKTQLAAMTMAAQTKRPWAVFIGASLALAAVSALGVIVGSVIGDYIPLLWVKRIAAIAFIAIGVLMLAGKF